ncbi:cupin domain-containing protein [Azotosporobacter soli]|uniref:cupin domain-containing protein n=1 Tax=Azotosporobacter soli TaxID=3055040 RepID=UPI0031FF1615
MFMHIKNIHTLFEELVPDEKTDVQLRTIIDGETAFILAELKPGKCLRAHYHHSGSEIYHVLEGSGEMEFGRWDGATVTWTERCSLKAGDAFAVLPDVVHRLSNTHDERLRLVFLAPPAHLSDEDRFFV